MYKIYIIEDDQKIKEELSTLFLKYGYATQYSNKLDNIVEEALNSNSHLVLIDINLPMYDGYHICRQIRKKSNVPIIIVTSRNTEADELMSMSLGADDFVTKPYNTQILLSRIASVLKRAYNTENISVISHNDVTLDISKSLVIYNDEKIELTKNELKILYILFKNAGNIISRDDIMSELWQSEEFVDDNTLTVNINRIRKKLEDIGIKDFLITKRGQGYMI